MTIDQDNIFLPGFGGSKYLDLKDRVFSTQWPPYYGHILQGLQGELEFEKCLPPKEVKNLNHRIGTLDSSN